MLQLRELVQHLGLSHPPTALLGLSVLVGLLILGRIAPVVPGALVAVVAGIGAVALLRPARARRGGDRRAAERAADTACRGVRACRVPQPAP